MADQGRLFDPPATCCSQGPTQHGPQAHRIVHLAARSADRGYSATAQAAAAHLPRRGMSARPARAGPEERSEPSLRLNAATGHRQHSGTTDRWPRRQAPDVKQQRAKRWRREQQANQQHTDQGGRHTDEARASGSRTGASGNRAILRAAGGLSQLRIEPWGADDRQQPRWALSSWKPRHVALSSSARKAPPAGVIEGTRRPAPTTDSATVGPAAAAEGASRPRRASSDEAPRAAEGEIPCHVSPARMG